MTLSVSTPVSDLFTAGEKPAPKNKIRPLGILSDFVVEKFPARIAAGDPHLAQEIENIIGDRQFTIPATQIEIARLDAIMIEAGLRMSGAKPGRKLQKLIGDLSRRTGQRPIISYQDIVLYNPPGDMRTFTGGSTAKQEMDFYIGHQMIESCLWRSHKAAAAIH